MKRQSNESEPVGVIRELYRLFGAGQLDETIALMAPDIVLREPGDPDVLPWAGVFEGHDGVRRFYAGLARGLSSLRIEPDSLRFLPLPRDQVLVLGTERGTSASTGRGYVTESAWLWKVRDGLVRSLTAYHDTWAMMNAMRE